MILGVVLGDIAELNLARALAINADPMLFITRPWSLFFAIIAVFSTIFPLFQKQRGSGAACWDGSIRRCCCWPCRPHFS